jgi:type II secretory pathway pseudopilin PulG
VTAPWPHGDPRELVHRVLADPRFQRAAQRPNQKSWWDYVTDAVREVWRRLTGPLQHLAGDERSAAIIGYVVIALVAAVAVVLLVNLAKLVYRRRAPRARAAAAEALAAGSDARSLLARALDAASAGRHHEAAALLWASALRALDERGRVRFDPARTPGEWRRAVRDPSFDALARDAVVALFGDRGADAALVARMRESYDRVVAA